MLNCAYYYYRNFMTQFSKWLSDLFQFWLSFSFLPTLPNHKFPPPLHLKVSYSQLMIFPYSALGMQAHPGRLLLLFHDPRPAVTPPHPDFPGWMVFLCAHPCNPQQGKQCLWSPLEWNPGPRVAPAASLLSCCLACSPGSTHISTSKALDLVLGPLCRLIHQQKNSTTSPGKVVSFSDPARHSFRVTISERPSLISQIGMVLPGTFCDIFLFSVFFLPFPRSLPSFLPPVLPSYLLSFFPSSLWNANTVGLSLSELRVMWWETLKCVSITDLPEDGIQSAVGAMPPHTPSSEWKIVFDLLNSFCWKNKSYY